MLRHVSSADFEVFSSSKLKYHSFVTIRETPVKEGSGMFPSALNDAPSDLLVPYLLGAMFM